MRARKVISWSLVTLVILVLAGGWLSYRAFKGTPDYYHRPQLTDAERADAAQRALDKFISTKAWADDVWTGEQRAINAGTTRPATPAHTISFTEDELNAFFERWSVTYRWDEHYSRYVKDPTIALRDGRIILAGTVPELGTVASFHFAPSIDGQGKFQLKLAGVRAGRLPMPEMAWSSQRDRVEMALRQRLPRWQKNAKIAPSGVANESAIAADASKMLLEMLDERSREPVMFLPFEANKAVPVRLTAVRVSDGELTFTAAPVAPAERAALLERLREPEPAAQASAE